MRNSRPIRVRAERRVDAIPRGPIVTFLRFTPRNVRYFFPAVTISQSSVRNGDIGNPAPL